MSGKRIVEETLCEHGQDEPHSTEFKELLPGGRWLVEEDWCSGGPRRTLTEGQYVLIEWGDDWNRDDLNRIAWVLQDILRSKLNGDVTWGDSAALLKRLAPGPDPDRPWLPPQWQADALSDHTEGPKQ